MDLVKRALAAVLVAGLAAVMLSVPASARTTTVHDWYSWGGVHQGVKARYDGYTFNRWIPWQFQRKRGHASQKRQVRVVGHYHWNASGSTPARNGNWHHTAWTKIRAGQRLTTRGPIKTLCNSSSLAMLIEVAQVRTKKHGH